MRDHDCPLSKDDILRIKDFKTTNENFSHMQEDIQSLKEDQTLIKSDLKEIKDALLGDKFNPGFKQRIERVEKDTFDNSSQLGRLKNYWVAFITILGLVGTTFGIIKIFLK